MTKLIDFESERSSKEKSSGFSFFGLRKSTQENPSSASQTRKGMKDGRFNREPCLERPNMRSKDLGEIFQNWLERNTLLYTEIFRSFVIYLAQMSQFDLQQAVIINQMSELFKINKKSNTIVNGWIELNSLKMVSSNQGVKRQMSESCLESRQKLNYLYPFENDEMYTNSLLACQDTLH